MSDSVENVTSVVGEQDVLATPISDLFLHYRGRKCVAKLGVTKVGDLLRLSAEDLLCCKNFGMISLNEVREKLAELGLKLRGD